MVSDGRTTEAEALGTYLIGYFRRADRRAVRFSYQAYRRAKQAGNDPASTAATVFDQQDDTDIKWLERVSASKGMEPRARSLATTYIEECQRIRSEWASLIDLRVAVNRWPIERVLAENMRREWCERTDGSLCCRRVRDRYLHIRQLMASIVEMEESAASERDHRQTIEKLSRMTQRLETIEEWNIAVDRYVEELLLERVALFETCVLRLVLLNPQPNTADDCDALLRNAYRTISPLTPENDRTERAYSEIVGRMRSSGSFADEPALEHTIARHLAGIGLVRQLVKREVNHSLGGLRHRLALMHSLRRLPGVAMAVVMAALVLFAAFTYLDSRRSEEPPIAINESAAISEGRENNAAAGGASGDLYTSESSSAANRDADTVVTADQDPPVDSGTGSARAADFRTPLPVLRDYPPTESPYGIAQPANPSGTLRPAREYRWQLPEYLWVIPISLAAACFYAVVGPPLMRMARSNAARWFTALSDSAFPLMRLLLDEHRRKGTFSDPQLRFISSSLIPVFLNPDPSAGELIRIKAFLVGLSPAQRTHFSAFAVLTAEPTSRSVKSGFWYNLYTLFDGDFYRRSRRQFNRQAVTAYQSHLRDIDDVETLHRRLHELTRESREETGSLVLRAHMAVMTLASILCVNLAAFVFVALFPSYFTGIAGYPLAVAISLVLIAALARPVIHFLLVPVFLGITVIAPRMSKSFTERMVGFIRHLLTRMGYKRRPQPTPIVDTPNTGYRSVLERALSTRRPVRLHMSSSYSSDGVSRQDKVSGGQEPEERRAYVPGDDTRHIDWKMFARSDKMLIRQSRERSHKSVALLIDLRTLSDKYLRDRWVRDLSNAISLLFPGRNKRKDVELCEAVFIRVGGEVTHLPRSAAFARLDELFAMLGRYLSIDTRDNNHVNDRFVTGSLGFYTAQENARYLRKTAVLHEFHREMRSTNSFRNARIALNSRDMLKGRHVLAVGVDPREFDDLSAQLALRSSKLFRWMGQHARPHYRRHVPVR